MIFLGFFPMNARSRAVVRMPVKRKHQKGDSERCPDCGSNNIIKDYERGETCCGDCGLVFPEVILGENFES